MLHANDNTLKIGPELDAGLRDDPGLRKQRGGDVLAAGRGRGADVRDELRHLARGGRR